MRPGPKPKPTTLKLLHGTKPSRVNFDEPATPAGPPVCPDEASDEVRAVWDYAMANLVVMGIATMADRDALLCYCEAVVVHRRASKDLADGELLIEGHRGVMVRNPAFTMQRDAANVIRQFASEFGFTPSARSEIRKGGAAAPDAPPAARYLNA